MNVRANMWDSNTLSSAYVYAVTITDAVVYETHTHACDADTAFAIIQGHVLRAQTHPWFYPRGAVTTAYKLPREHIYRWTGGVCDMHPTRPCGLVVVPLGTSKDVPNDVSLD